MPTVNTVSGPVDTADLGFTLMHEHIIVESPGVKENFPIFDREAEIEKAVGEAKGRDGARREDAGRPDAGRLARHPLREGGRRAAAGCR